MFRVIFLIFFMILTAVSARAQELVEVRAGEHEGYSRLVFDWKNKVDYTVAKNEDGTVSVVFQKNALLDRDALDTKIANHVEQMEVAAQDPLTVILHVPEGADIKAFQAGSRVLVDVHAAAGAKDIAPAAGEKVAAAPAEKAGPVEKVEQKPAQQDTGQKDAVKAAETFGPPAPAQKAFEREVVPEIVKVQAPDTRELARPLPVAPVATAKPDVKKALPLPKPEAAAEAPPPSLAKKLPDPTVISMSAIDSIDLAVFERGGKIWLISHLQNLMLRPQVSGSMADAFLPLKVSDREDVRIFHLNKPAGPILRAQGGGVLWRILAMAETGVPSQEKIAPVAPERRADGTLLWPFKEIGRLTDIEDPVSGKMLKVVTVRSSEQYAGPMRDYVEFEVVPSPLGIAILPKVDDLQVALTPAGLEISRAGGLHLASPEDVEAVLKNRVRNKTRPKADPNARRIFDFNDWRMGSLSMIEQNKNVLLADIPRRAKVQQPVAILRLAKLYLSHGMWAEAMGFLTFAEREAPELAQNPEFLALRGAAQVLGLESEDGFNNLSNPALEFFPEIGYWRAFALAHLGDWQQAAEIMPRDFGILAEYPPDILNRLGLTLAEIALREGDKNSAAQILTLVADDEGELPFHQKADFDYLKGELARQNEKVDVTKSLWEPLTKGRDEQFRVKATLAMTRLLYDEKKITPQEAINRLEPLRYAWRGDELEAQVNYWLGHMYFQKGDYVKGLRIMRDAAGYAAGTDLGKTVAEEMAQAFSDLFLGPQFSKVSAVDAAVIYNEFSELIPPGTKGDLAASRLVDHLIRYDLFHQAETLLQTQFDRRLQGVAAYDAGVRLAAIYLLDKKPVNAISVLNKSLEHLRKLPAAEQTPVRARQVTLLRARAFSAQNKPDQAMEILAPLSDGADVNRLRADIAWRAGYWDDAAEALGYVVGDENIPISTAPSEDQTSLLLRYAVALNLSNDRIRLANLRAKYGAAMAQSDKARVFEMVTRSWQDALLEDREALMSMVSEVDLFENFLNNSGGAQAAPATQ